MRCFQSLILAAVLVVNCIGQQIDIVDTIRGSGQSQFVSLLEQALDQSLLALSNGSYTVLVPTDDAFNKLPQEELNNIKNDGAALKDLIEYHIIRGQHPNASMISGVVFTTINGHAIRVYTTTSRNIYLNNAKVVQGELQASNGIIFFIDQVLDVPEGTIYAVAKNPEYPLSTFASYLYKVGLSTTLNYAGGTKYTVFAPSNEAFSKLNPVILENINAYTYYVRELVYYHIHTGTLHLKSLDRNSTITTLESGHPITVTVDSDIHLNRLARFEQTDIDCDNGVIHIIDHVLIPNSLVGIIG